MERALIRRGGGGTQLMMAMAMAIGSARAIISDDNVRAQTRIERMVKDKKNFQVISIHNQRNSTQIAFLKHINGTAYVVKQRTIAKLDRHMNVIRDVLGSRIALEGGVPVNVVAIIPRGYAFPGKYSKEFPASLHEVVPGIPVSDLPPELETFKRTIKQCLRTNKCEVYGLTRDIITNMAFHPDLCRIVALDTFIANKGRDLTNFFYDFVSDHYYAIDLASSFEYDAGHYACVLIESMVKDKNCFLSKQELEGLVIYRNSLKTLLEKFVPDSIYKQMVDLAVQGGFISRAHVTKSMERHKTVIRKNYESCKRLVVLLHIFIEKHSTDIS